MTTKADLRKFITTLPFIDIHGTDVNGVEFAQETLQFIWALENLKWMRAFRSLERLNLLGDIHSAKILVTDPHTGMVESISLWTAALNHNLFFRIKNSFPSMDLRVDTVYFS